MLFMVDDTSSKSSHIPKDAVSLLPVVWEGDMANTQQVSLVYGLRSMGLSLTLRSLSCSSLFNGLSRPEARSCRRAIDKAGHVGDDGHYLAHHHRFN